ncbi:quinoprotein dehydrogenase-associated SoxYZ-like carrier [Zoogloeaceae bacteirum Par-f-2]|nr:quinoprotein dehydrogenase-associated SoxYZ-like carrier [Zoogloeaceae bacteirum Par-f-2]
MRIFINLVALAMAGAASLACAAKDDPLDSVRWQDMRAMFFADAPVVFDERVQVHAPATAENPLDVPVLVDATRLPGVVEEVVVFADFNPIVKALDFQPLGARASLGFRLKLQQSSPVRAAARTADGRWHVGGTWVNTTGGGCTLPSTGSGSTEWQERLNEVSARIWPRIDGGLRVRLRIIHPMDTGLAPGVPVFHIDTLTLRDAAGAELMRIHPAEPVAENPVFTVDLPPSVAAGPLALVGRDNNGNRIAAEVAR